MIKDRLRNILHNRQHSSWFVLLLMCIAALLISSILNDGHDWRGDFAMYVSQAESLLNGSLDELYEMNRYSMDHSETVLGPYLYQFGYPVLLAPILYFFGLDFFALKWLCGVCLLLSIPVMHRLFRPHFKSEFYSLAIVAAIGINSYYITFCDSILSDLPFLFFSIYTLHRMSARPTILNQLVLGLLIYFSYLIRDIGIVLLPSLAVFQMLRLKDETNLNSFRKRQLIPYVVFLFLFLLAAQFLPSGQENHIRALFSEVSLDSIKANAEYYRDILIQFFRIGLLERLILNIILAFMVIGAVVTARRSAHLLVFVLLSIVILMIWPYRQGIRFLFPLLPFFIFYFIKGISLLFQAIRAPRFVSALTVIILLCFQIIRSAQDISNYAKTDTNLCYTTEMRSMYDFMSTELPKDRIVVNYYPRVLRLFTGMNSIRIGQYEFENSEAFYLQTGKAYLDPNVLQKFEVIFETENEILIGKKSD